MKGNIIQMNTLHLNSVRLNGIGKVQSVSLKGGSTEDPVFPPVEPPIEPEPTPTYTLSASVTNGMVSAKRNGSAVNLPFTANEGDVIVVEVTPNDGYAFEGWNDGNTDNPRTITMNADVALSAQCVEVVQPPVGNYIQFEDKAVEAICVANWSSDGIGLTEEDAAKVTDIGTKFNGNTEIKRFNEFRYFVAVRSLSGKDSMSNIAANGAFYGCSALQSIQFPPSLETINGGAFANTTALAINVDVPSLKNIRNNAFRKSGIISITNLGTISELGTYGTMNYGGEGVFYGCANLTIAEIPSSVINIPPATFYNCSALTKIICRANIPPTLGNYAFNATNNCPIYVPDASLEAYKTATNWNNFSSRIKPLSELSDE